jgi:hypothetical protein
VLRGDGDANGFHPLVHRHDRLRRHLLRSCGNSPRGHEVFRTGTPYRFPPHDW